MQPADHAEAASLRRVIIKAFQHFVQTADDKARKSADRVVKVWEERRVFSPHHAKHLKDALKASTAAPRQAPAGKPAAEAPGGPPSPQDLQKRLLVRPHPLPSFSSRSTLRNEGMLVAKASSSPFPCIPLPFPILPLLLVASSYSCPSLGARPSGRWLESCRTC